MSAHVSIVLPTYREAANLPHLVPRIAASLDAEGTSFEIVVVDDASGDGTSDVCARLAERYPVRLVVRENGRGLATAVIRGCREATGDVFVALDADACDFAIGSRYVRGGSTEEGRGVLRWLNSKVATVLARPLTKAKDPMSGYFALRRETFLRAPSLNPIGYKIGLELIVKCRCRRVIEIPIHFKRRRFGESKLGLRTRLAYLGHLARLYGYVARRLVTRRG